MVRCGAGIGVRRRPVVLGSPGVPFGPGERDGVDPPGGPGMAAPESAGRQPATLEGAEPLERLDRIRRARGVEAAGRGSQRRHEPLVEPDEPDEGQRQLAAERRAGTAPPSGGHDDNRGREWSSRFTWDATESANSWYVACAAAGLARTTTSTPSGMPLSWVAMMARSRRLVRFRVTALPTALDTTKPTRGGRSVLASVRLACTTTSRPPALLAPGPRTADVKSARSRRR